jgi:hypothetical protein
MRKPNTISLFRYLLLLTLICTSGLTYSQGLCPSGTISGYVFQDFNFDGVDNDNGVGLENLEVFLFDQTGLVQTTTTDLDGSYSFAGLSDGRKYRVEFHSETLVTTGQGLKSTLYSAGSKTSVQFVSSPSCNTNQGIANPTDFCQPEPLVLVPCFVNGNPAGGGTAGSTASILAIPYDATGQGQTANTVIANTVTTGANWGVAYQRSSRIAFTASLLRRHSGFGPSGTGAIYPVDLTNPASPIYLPAINLDAMGFNTGTDPRILEPLPADRIQPSHDVAAYPLVGRMSLGDIELSEDGKYLYVVNLFDRSLYKIFIDNPYQAPTAADVTIYPMTNPGTGPDSDWVPWSVREYNGEIYVGLTTTGQTSQSINDVRAYVKKLNSSGGFDAVFDMPMDYQRGPIILNTPSINTWFPWTDDYNMAFNTTGTDFKLLHPQPILSDLIFDIDGSLILGFADRLALQGGYLNYLPNTTLTGPVTAFSGGDIIRVCNIGGNFVLEGTTNGCNTGPRGINNEGPDGGEFYWSDAFRDITAAPLDPALVIHHEFTLGALSLLPGRGEVLSTIYDPYVENTGGFTTFNNSTGGRNNSYEIFPDLSNASFFGKAAGLGASEVLCDEAPLEKGNFVWNDRDRDGIQDPNELPIAGVNVSLYVNNGGDCTQIATTVTNTAGEYYFNNNTPGFNGLQELTEYYIVVGNAGQFDSGTLMLFDSLVLTVPNTGEGAIPNLNDSDGELTSALGCLENLPHVRVVTGGPGHVDHTCDFGFYKNPCDINFSAFVIQAETCAGLANGSVTANATSSNPVEYQLNTAPYSATNTWSNLTPGIYTVRARDIGTTDCLADSTFSISAGAPNPVPVLSGDFFPCQGETVTYSIGFNFGSSYNWSINGGGTVISQSFNTFTVLWNAGAGTSGWKVSVTETTEAGCIGMAMAAVTIRSSYLVCNDQVNISLTDNCKSAIRPEDVLNGNYSTYDGFTVMVTALTPGTMVIGGDTIMGKGNYTYKVIEPCTGNTCWGNIKAEDKQAPVINCQLMSVACNYRDTNVIIPSLVAMPTFAVIGGGIGGVVVNDNCGLARIQYSDEFIDVNCTDYFGVLSAIIIRHWTAVDMSGNVGTCDQEIRFIRQSLDNLIFPDAITLQCPNNNTSPSNTGTPTIAGQSAFPNSFFCELNVTYTDQVLPICEGSYKIFRTWKAVDWCLSLNANNPNLSQNPRTKIQIITVEDKTGPAFTCPADAVVSTNAANCIANYNLPDVTASDVCSSILSGSATTAFGSVNATINGSNVVFGTLNNIPTGEHIVTYSITDKCGNASTCSFEITVRDNLPPNPICTELTNVSLGQDGKTLVLASAFDQGSYDDCGSVYFKARRMDGTPCETTNDLLFRDKVAFCCTDLGVNPMVILRVYDQEPVSGAVPSDYLEGHYNDCMVEVMVEDKMKPFCTPPANVTVSCESYDPSLWQYGNATYGDNCHLDTTYQSLNYTNFDQTCNRGTIRRNFFAVDAFGNQGSCSQTVVVTYNTSFSVKFPDDVLLTQCAGNGNYGTPIITGKDCELTGISYTDQVFTLVPDACFKIIRTWKIVDWCDYNSNINPIFVNNPLNTDIGATVFANGFNHGYFQYTQIIKVIDNEKPVITNCPTNGLVFNDFSNNDPLRWNNLTYWDAAHSSHDLCEGSAEMSIRATDACSGNNLTFSYTIQLDFNNDGIFDQTLQSGQPNTPLILTTSDTISRTARISGAYQFPHGNHKIFWLVRDGCGNEESCHYTFTVRDGKKPTAVCHNGLSVNIMQNGTITMWASDFLNYAEDNCTPANQLEIAIRRSDAGTGLPFPTTTSVSFSCDDIGANVVQVWARDKAGNADFCEAFISVQDNMNNCSNTQARIAGAIQTEEIEGVEGAMVKVTGSSNIFPPVSMLTLNDGNFNFNAIPIGDNYTISPVKDNNWLNGISTYDLVLITRHITSFAPFDSPYKVIAADVNKSGTVTTFDIVQLRKLILGVIDSIPGNDSWRFINKSQTFNDILDPFAQPLQEKITFGSLQNGINTGDFVGIKVGDVNNTATANLTSQSADRTAVGTLNLDLEDRQLKAGEEVLVKFNSDDLAQVLGYQMALAFNTEEMEIVNITAGNVPDMNQSNFGTSRLNEGFLTTSWNTTLVGVGTKEVFSLLIRVKKDGTLSKMIRLSNRITNTEAYNHSGGILDINLRFGKTNTSTGEGVAVELYQNEPNPFTEKTTISFYLPEAAKIKLTILDAKGQVVKSIRGEYPKGTSELVFEKSLFRTSGVYSYRLDTPKSSLTKKMIFSNR